MHALVTGGAGFLGSHLCKSLIDDGFFVTILDDLSTGSQKNLESLPKNSFNFINHDICNEYSGLVKNIDQLWNLACPASPPAYQADRYKTLMTSVKGVENALNCAWRQKAKVFHTSTSEVYGDPLVHPQTEMYWGNVNTTGPRSCYDEGKRVAETMLTDFSKQFGVPVKIVRIFNTYGPNMDPQDGRVVSNFIMQALRHEPFTIYGTGKQTRSFCYVSDMIAGFRKLMDETSDLFIEPINIGNPNEFTLMELADMVAEKVGIKPVFMFKSLPGDDPKQRRPDISKAQRVLNWEPKVMLSEGLDKTIEYFKTK